MAHETCNAFQLERVARARNRIERVLLAFRHRAARDKLAPIKSAFPERVSQDKLQQSENALAEFISQMRLISTVRFRLGKSYIAKLAGSATR